MFKKEIESLINEGLYREINDREGAQGRFIALKGKKLLNFSSNDYLGFSSDPFLMRLWHDAVHSYGFGAGASRLLSGGSKIYQDVEAIIARFKSTERSLILNSGYAANLGAIPALTGENDAIFSDEMNHASIIDGCRLSKASVHIYHHRDVAHLRELMKDSSAKRRLVITDTVFSMDGDIAPLPDILDVCREFEAILYLDDAHGTGVLGKGRGALTHFGLESEQFVIQMGTLSKAIGAFGAFIAADSTIVDYCINTMRSLIFSTALPSPIISFAKIAIEHLMSDISAVERLWRNTERMHEGLDEIDIDRGNSLTPIIPVILESVDNAIDLSQFLFKNDVYVPFIRPPAVKKPRIRISLSAVHRKEDIRALLGLLGDYFGKQ